MLKYIETYKRCEEERNKERDLMYEETERIKEKIEERKKQIERLEKKLEKRQNDYYKKDFPNWVETIVKPLMYDLEKKQDYMEKYMVPLVFVVEHQYIYVKIWRNQLQSRQHYT